MIDTIHFFASREDLCNILMRLSRNLTSSIVLRVQIKK